MRTWCAFGKTTAKWISIPKGAIMRRALMLKPSSVTDFNSKRCDYENTWFFIVPMFFYFNSKRCDYEHGNVSLYSYSHIISIPKGAIMRRKWLFYTVSLHHFNSKRCDYESGLKPLLCKINIYFNSKRCDYEIAAMFTVMLIVDFNSKRCDYELYIYGYKKNTLLIISIPKGAIMSYNLLFGNKGSLISIPKGAIMSARKVFKSSFFIISIPKGAIMSYFNLFFHISFCYFNSKRCDYETQP